VRGPQHNTFLGKGDTGKRTFPRGGIKYKNVGRCSEKYAWEELSDKCKKVKTGLLIRKGAGSPATKWGEWGPLGVGDFGGAWEKK